MNRRVPAEELKYARAVPVLQACDPILEQSRKKGLHGAEPFGPANPTGRHVGHSKASHSVHRCLYFRRNGMNIGQ